jgi:hypothetical protein
LYIVTCDTLLDGNRGDLPCATDDGARGFAAVATPCGISAITTRAAENKIGIERMLAKRSTTSRADLISGSKRALSAMRST